MTKFPKVLAAARQIELDQWELGDALIEEIGEPVSRAARENTRDGSLAKLHECSEFLAGHGLPDYSVSYLAKLRNTAFDFQGRNRKPNISWSAHNEASTPSILREVITQLGDDKPSRAEVRTTKRELYPSERPSRPEPRNEYGGELGATQLNLVVSFSHESAAVQDKIAFVEDHLGELSESTLDLVSEQLLELTEICRKASAKFRKSGTKRGHLNVVGGAA